MIKDISEPGGAYRPGACNIGPAEIGRRRRSALATTALAIGVAVAVVIAGLPPLAYLVELPFAAAAAVNWLQVTRRFCVAFGAAGVLNFGRLGRVESVTDAAARAADRRMALRMTLEGVVYGGVVTLLFWIVPAWLRSA
ncbi:MAG: hypothetical protein HY264_03185 [Chloroflexi bacterium]|nr:hypothetical protein [Chloroflexota bacterium]